MLTFTPDGRYLLVANEGEPNDDYSVDPEGSVSIIDMRFGPLHARVRTADFRRFNGSEAELQAKGIRLFGPGASAAQDIEPEYITVARNSLRAWVSLQEANALAVIDIPRAEVISNNDENDSFDSRSDDKGPEPEGLALGRIGGRTIAFIGLERIGGIMAYDITNPFRVKFLDYVNHRDFGVDAQLSDGSVNPLVGDLGPEGLLFINAASSPHGKALLVVGNEISGTTTLYEIDVKLPRKWRKD